ncbi:hypothetical protein [Fluviispira multicolorata]|uniref:Uncharacterized protein n=1 Tax=Fluviispira multicolorata TaxID=2654512 RepID=A0A833JF76_9BACT|nr:hypothetical protein [Fluviispira multicolorata]KAB8033584.1 hypothetical protein GCL57_02430 [Fluviispira multicolorata]
MYKFKIKLVTIILFTFSFYTAFPMQNSTCISNDFKEINILSTEHKKIYEAKEKLIEKIKNPSDFYNKKTALISKDIQKGIEPFSFAEYSDNYGLNQKYYSINSDLKFKDPIEGEHIFLDFNKSGYTQPYYKIISHIMSQTFYDSSGELKIYILKSKYDPKHTIVKMFKEERPNIKLSVYLWNHKSEKINSFFLKHESYVTLPIKFQTDIESTYRLDSRPPSIILTRGFEGANTALPNKIFGDNTVFSARDEDGAKFFYREVVRAFRDTKDPQFGGRKLYLYKINSQGFPAVDLQKASQEFGLEHFSRQISTRDYNVNSNSKKSIQFSAYIRAKKYLNLTARFNKEVQLSGPIPFDKIEFIREMPEIK